MSQREWIEKDFYKELGVSSSASAAEIKKAYRKLARDLHPDAHPGDTATEERFKAVSEAHAVLSDPVKRKEYDETRQMFRAGGGGFGQGFGPGAGSGGFSQGFDMSDLFGTAGGEADLGDLFGGLFGQTAGRSSPRSRRGKDVETETTLGFREAAMGATVPLRLTSPAPCATCRGSGAEPGTTPRTCRMCQGAGVISRNQGAFGFSEPCPECRGTGSLIDNPCQTCHGTGVQSRTRTITVRIPPGVVDGQRVRLPGKGEPGRRGAAAGDLFVTVHVSQDKVFGRKGDDLTLTLPVDYSELVLGTTVSVPTLQGRVGVKVPPGTAAGRILRVRGRGIPKREGGAGDLLVTVEVAVPAKLDDAGMRALQEYQTALRASGFDPRAGWAGA